MARIEDTVGPKSTQRAELYGFYMREVRTSAGGALPSATAIAIALKRLFR